MVTVEVAKAVGEVLVMVVFKLALEPLAIKLLLFLRGKMKRMVKKV